MKQLFALLLVFIPLTGRAQMQSLRRQVQREYMALTPSDDVHTWQRTIRRDGTWPDIDYADRSRSRWQMEVHIDRLIDMALVCARDSRYEHVMLPHVFRGLQHFFDGNYHNDNWWYTKIGIPRRMLVLAYLLDDHLPDALRNSIAQQLRYIDADDYPARPGGDRIQVLSNHAKVLLWQRDTLAAARLFALIEAEAQVAPIEEIMYDAAGGMEVRNGYRPAGRGLQADFTFHHRGDRVNSTLTYGLELPEYYAYWAAMLKDTPWQFSQEHTHRVIDYYLDGVVRHLVGGRYFEPSAYNRELSRPGEGVVDSRLARRLLSVSEGYRSETLQQVIDAQDGHSVYRPSWAHHFWQSDYFVFARPQFQTAVRLHSWRNANQEADHNSEGLRNHFRGDGASMLSITGSEYLGLWPVFDFRRVPGATTPLVPYAPLDSWGPVQQRQSPTIYAGAVCDSLYGAVAFDFKSSRSDLQARKAWFFFDRGYVCLGSDISSSAADTIVTTIEQCRQHGHVDRQGAWIFHHGNAYHVHSGDVACTTEWREGTWRNCIDGVSYADNHSADSVFTLTISHGVAPRQATYAYAVVPGCNRPEEPWYTILHNGDGLQAVESNDGTLAYLVFYRPGNVATRQGVVSVDAPCMVMIRHGEVTVSDPTHTLYQLTLTLSGSSVTIPLPTYLNAGKSVKATAL